MTKFLKINSSGRGFIEEATATAGGAPNANKVPNLDSNGRLTSDMMPTGIGADTATIVASENCGAGAAVNIYDNGGTVSIRNADKGSGKPADGFVIAAVNSGNNGIVYFEGNNTGVTGLTPGSDYWLGSNGAYSATKTTTSGDVLQYMGKAVSATQLNWEPSEPVTLA